MVRGGRSVAVGFGVHQVAHLNYRPVHAQLHRLRGSRVRSAEAEMAVARPLPDRKAGEGPTAAPRRSTTAAGGAGLLALIAGGHRRACWEEERAREVIVMGR